MVRNNIDQSLIATLAGILMLCGASQCHNPELPAVSVSPSPNLSQKGNISKKPKEPGGGGSIIIDTTSASSNGNPSSPIPESNSSQSQMKLLALFRGPESPLADRSGSAQAPASPSTPPPGSKSPVDESGGTHGRSSSLITHALTPPSDIPPMGPDTARRLGKGPEEQALERRRSGGGVAEKNLSVGNKEQSGSESPRGVAEAPEFFDDIEAPDPTAVGGARGQDGAATVGPAPTPNVAAVVLAPAAPEDVAPAASSGSKGGDEVPAPVPAGEGGNPGAAGEEPKGVALAAPTPDVAANSGDAVGQDGGAEVVAATPVPEVVALADEEPVPAVDATPADDHEDAGGQGGGAAVVAATPVPELDATATNPGNTVGPGENLDEGGSAALVGNEAAAAGEGGNPGAAGEEPKGAAPAAPTPDVAANSGDAVGQDGGAEVVAATPVPEVVALADEEPVPAVDATPADDHEDAGGQGGGAAVVAATPVPELDATATNPRNTVGPGENLDEGGSAALVGDEAAAAGEGGNSGDAAGQVKNRRTRKQKGISSSKKAGQGRQVQHPGFNINVAFKDKNKRNKVEFRSREEAFLWIQAPSSSERGVSYKVWFKNGNTRGLEITPPGGISPGTWHMFSMGVLDPSDSGIYSLEVVKICNKCVFEPRALSTPELKVLF